MDAPQNAANSLLLFLSRQIYRDYAKQRADIENIGNNVNDCPVFFICHLNLQKCIAIVISIKILSCQDELFLKLFVANNRFIYLLNGCARFGLVILTLLYHIFLFLS